MKKGGGRSSEKAKPLKYLYVTLAQWEVQLTMKGNSNPQLCRDKAVIINWLLEVPDSVVHMWVSLSLKGKIKIQECIFLKRNASLQYKATCLQGLSPFQVFFIFSFRAQNSSQESGCQQHLLLPRMLLRTSQLKAVARNSDSSIQGYLHHRFLLCPLPASTANPLIHCSQMHFHSGTLHDCVAMQTGNGWCWWTLGEDGIGTGVVHYAHTVNHLAADWGTQSSTRNGAVHFMFSHLIWAQNNERASLAMFSLLISHELR